MLRIIAGLIILIGIVYAGILTKVYENANIAELRGVFAFENGTVWAVGTDGSVLKSTDGGYNWSSVSITGASDYHLNAVFFSDESRGCIVGEKKANPNRFMGRAYYTTNGDSNWSVAEHTVEKDLPFKDIVFHIRDNSPNPGLGYIAAGQGYVYQTTNYGQAWTREIVGPKNVCFHGICMDLDYGNAVYACGDAGLTTGIYVSNSGSGWVVEYPYSNLGLNYFKISNQYNDPCMSASKGYCVGKPGGNWVSMHVLPDENVLYGIGANTGFGTQFFYGGSDEAFGRLNNEHILNNYGRYLLDVSLAKQWGFGPSLISTVHYLVGKGGRIFKYDPQFVPWPPTMTVYGESQRVRCVIHDSEEPSYAYIYRSSCPDGPFDLVAHFDIPVGYTTWYDNSVSFNLDYYYRIYDLPASGNPAHPTNLPNPTNPPQTPTGFSTSDYSNDDGGRVNTSWSGGSGTSNVLYRDDKSIYIGTNSSFTDTSAVTGRNHKYEIRKRKWYSSENEYVYSGSLTSYTTPVNNLYPSAPSSLSGERTAGDTMLIRWSAPSNIDLHGYFIYRKLDSGNYAKVNSVPNPRCYWRDAPGTSWMVIKYKVTAVDWCGKESGYSNEYTYDKNSIPDGGNEMGNESGQCNITELLVKPNPLSRSGVLTYSLSKGGDVRINLYNAAGRAVKVLSIGRQVAGRHEVVLNAEDIDDLSSGVYFLELSVDNSSAMERIVIWR